MHPSRTAVDWLIVIVNVLAILLGLAIGWMWIIDAAQHYQADDNHPNIRLGMCIGFIMAYLVWNSVVMTYLIVKRRPPTPGTGEKIKIKRSTLQAAIAQAQAERTVAEPEQAVTEPEPASEIKTMAEPATEANWDGTLPPVRRQDP